MDTPPSLTQIVYAYLVAYIEEHGYGPSLRNIAEDCHMAVATVAHHLDKLEAQGRITREFGQARSIRVAAPHREHF